MIKWQMADGGWIDMLNPEDRRKGGETKPTDRQKDGQVRYFSFLFFSSFGEIQEAGAHGKRETTNAVKAVCEVHQVRLRST